MTFLSISVAARSAMARRLAGFLTENFNLEIKHTLANKAIAAIFGHNEHSLSASIKNQGGIELDHVSQSVCVMPRCAVSGCTSDAVVEARLFDVYQLPESVRVFDEQDRTCPYLCGDHLILNERGAQGTRLPREVTGYPFTNQNRAQGVTVYRRLDAAELPPPHVKTEILIEDFGDGWSIDEALKHQYVTASRRDSNDFYIKLGALKTEIRIHLKVSEFGIEFEQSHVIKTPSQLGAYRTSRPWNDTPGSALRQAITGLTQYYEAEVNKGTSPSEDWLVPYNKF